MSSTEGKGSVFTVELPTSGAPPPLEQPLRVLVANTEREARSFIAHALREAGFRVRVAQTADEFLAMLEADHVDRVVFERDEGMFDSQQLAQLEQWQLQGRFRIVRLTRPFLAQDVISAIRSRPA